MKSKVPYCYLYKNSPDEGDLYVSTVVQLSAGKDLSRPSIKISGSTTTVSYTVVVSSLAEGVRKPVDVEIVWDGTERWVEVEVVDGTEKHTTFTNSDKAD